MTNNTVEKKLVKFASFWEKKSKEGKTYFSGTTENKDRLVMFVNRDKKNPQEPDLRVYKSDDTKKEVLSLWCNVSKTKKKYFSGKQDEKRYVGFYSDDTTNNRPNLTIFVEQEIESEGLSQGKAEDFEITEADDLPF